ncbi:MAG: hypothetical protein KUG67_02540, partial [Proteobacteria bacterium]|nr:hypothetical protein [Pseudomonadota bacterium]
QAHRASHRRGRHILVNNPLDTLNVFDGTGKVDTYASSASLRPNPKRGGRKVTRLFNEFQRRTWKAGIWWFGFGA